LPGFLLLHSSIWLSIQTFNQSQPLDCSQLPYLTFIHPLISGLPRLWLFLLLNVLTQFACSKSIFVLSEHCTSLTITLLITLRKFFSLIISIYLFRNPFTAYHWFGSLMVFAGTLLFADLRIPHQLRFWDAFCTRHAKHEKLS
jgi:UDP-xylose/UDP-N-acetylglucosamine transporter B4